MKNYLLLGIFIVKLAGHGFAKEVSYFIYERNEDRIESGLALKIHGKGGVSVLLAEVIDGRVGIAKVSQNGEPPNYHVSISDDKLLIWVGEDERSFRFLEFTVGLSGQIQLTVDRVVNPGDVADFLRERMKHEIATKNGVLAMFKVGDEGEKDGERVPEIEKDN